MPDMPTQNNSPDNDLSDSDIAFLCDIGEFDASASNEDKRGRLERMIAQGYVEASNAQQKPAKYQLTGKAENFLTARGVGLNEA